MATELKIDVTELDEPHRRALEEVIGQDLTAHQRLTIQVSEVDQPVETPAHSKQSLDEWTSIYSGLSEADIESIDKVIKTRANLSRNLP